MVFKQFGVLQNGIIDVEGWNGIDVQQEIMRSENTLNSNITKRVGWIDAIHIVHSLSLSRHIWNV